MTPLLTVRGVAIEEEEARYVLKLRVGDIVFKKGFSSWEELRRYKDIIKPIAKWDSIHRAWRIDGYVDNIDRVADAVSKVFNLDKERIIKILRKHNAEVIERYRKDIAGTKRIVLVTYLTDDQYSIVRMFCEHCGSRTFVFSEERFLKHIDIVNTTREKVIDMFESWISKLKNLPVVFDEDALRESINAILKRIEKMKTVRAEYIVEKEEKSGRERGWIKLVFNNELDKRAVWSIKEELMKIREIPYNIEVFEEGETRFKTIIIYGIKFDKNESHTIYVAPFMYSDIKKFLDSRGFKVDDTTIEKPATTPILDIQDIEHKLRPYQKEAFEKWIENGCRGCIAIPTGGGKTWIGLAAIARLRVPTVIFVPTIELAKQWKEKFLKGVLGLKDSDIGILGGGFHEIGKPVLVATYDSGVKYAKELAKKYALYIYDEGHHVAAETFKEIAWHMMAPYRIVLSATVERDDGNEELIYRMCGNKVYEIPFFELVKQGWLAPVKVEFIEIPFPSDQEKLYRDLENQLAEVKEKIRELYRRYEAEALKAGYTNVGDYLRKTKNPEYRELNSKAMSLRQRMRILEQRNENKIAKAVELAKKHIDEGNRIFVFTNLIEQAEKIYNEIRKFYPDVKLVTSKTSTQERELFFKLFANGRIRCIVTTTVLDEGIDAPDADVAIVVSSRAIRHPRQFVQRIGRIVRPKHDKISYVYIMRTEGGVEEATMDELYSELDRVYEFSRMDELIEARARTSSRMVFEAKATLEKAKRVGGHKARIVIYSSVLKELINRKVHVKVYTSDGKLVKEVDLKIGKKIYKGYEYGKLAISLPVDYGGEKMIIEIYPF